MKSEDLLRAIGEIDEVYVEEAAKPKRRRFRPGWVICAAAAAIVLLVALRFYRPLTSKEGEVHSGTKGEAFSVQEPGKAAAAQVTEEMAEEEAAGAGEAAPADRDAGDAAGDLQNLYDAAAPETAAVEEDAYTAAGAAMEEDADDAAGEEEAAETEDAAGAEAAGKGEDTATDFGSFIFRREAKPFDAAAYPDGEELAIGDARVLVLRDGDGIRSAIWGDSGETCVIEAKGASLTEEMLRDAYREVIAAA